MAQRKTFKKENPADEFISTAHPTEATADDTAIEKKQDFRNQTDADGKRIRYVPVEKRDRRVQLMLTQSLYDQTRAAADEKGVSFNELVCEILENAQKT